MRLSARAAEGKPSVHTTTVGNLLKACLMVEKIYIYTYASVGMFANVANGSTKSTLFLQSTTTWRKMFKGTETQRLRSTKFWTIQKKNFTKLLAKKRENPSSEVPRMTGKKQICKLFYSARIFLHLNIWYKTLIFTTHWLTRTTAFDKETDTKKRRPIISDGA